MIIFGHISKSPAILGPNSRGNAFLDTHNQNPQLRHYLSRKNTLTRKNTTILKIKIHCNFRLLLKRKRFFGHRLSKSIEKEERDNKRKDTTISMTTLRVYEERGDVYVKNMLPKGFFLDTHYQNPRLRPYV